MPAPRAHVFHTTYKQQHQATNTHKQQKHSNTQQHHISFFFSFLLLCLFCPSFLFFVFYLVSFFVFAIVSNDVSCFLLCLRLFSLCFHVLPMKIKNVTCVHLVPSLLSLLSHLLSPSTLISTLQNQLRLITKNNPSLHSKYVFFDPEFCDALLIFISRPLISLFFCSQGYTWNCKGRLSARSCKLGNPASSAVLRVASRLRRSPQLLAALTHDHVQSWRHFTFPSFHSFPAFVVVRAWSIILCGE